MRSRGAGCAISRRASSPAGTRSALGEGAAGVRRVGIVALARRLLVELWRYLETGAIPEGAVLKTRLI